MKNKLLPITITVALALFIVCSGCVTDSPVKTEKTEIPEGLSDALEELEYDLKMLEYSVLSDLKNLAKEIGNADEKRVSTLLSEFYAEHPRITCVIYRDTVHGEYYAMPVSANIDYSSYQSKITEEDFRKSNGVLIRNSVFTENRGYQNLYYRAVYDDSGAYHGYLVFVIDPYLMIYLSSDKIGKGNIYNGYICFITDDKNRVLFSSIEESIGEVISPEGYFDGLAYIPRADGETGAFKYTSRGHFLYDEETQSEKITAWRKIQSSNGNEYTLYLIKTLNQPELETKNVFKLDTLQCLNDVRGAFIYASENGVSKLRERIESGYYKSTIYLINQNGDVISSSDKRKEGLNYLNNRGLYGVSFIKSAIAASEEGGGYIYSLTPAERVIKPRAAAFTIGIVMPVKNNYFIYCKTPGSTDLVMKNNNLRTDLLKITNKMLTDVSKKGGEAVAETINTKGRETVNEFVPKITTDVADIAILDVKGNVYASIMHKELVGKSATFMTDAYGNSMTRRSDNLAKTSGGFLTYLTKNKDKEGYVDLWVASVEPIDEIYYVYASTLITTFEDVLTPVLENVKPTK